jgi:hypothetical protein
MIKGDAMLYLSCGLARSEGCVDFLVQAHSKIWKYGLGRHTVSRLISGAFAYKECSLVMLNRGEMVLEVGPSKTTVLASSF